MANTAKTKGAELDKSSGKSKFERNLTLSHSEIRGKRAGLINKDAEDAMDELVRETASRLRKIDRSILDLEDLHPDYTTSLKVGKDFDAKDWVNEIQRLKVERVILTRELQIAIDTQSEFFSV